MRLLWCGESADSYGCLSHGAQLQHLLVSDLELHLDEVEHVSEPLEYR